MPCPPSKRDTAFFVELKFVLKKFAQLKNMSYLCGHKTQGSLAEWLGTGLQNRLQQFDSARNLKTTPDKTGVCF